MSASAVHYLTVGHLAKDLTPDGHRLGGTAAYSALTAGALGYAPGIVTACGPDLDLAPLAGLPLAAEPSTFSTTFENIYRPSGRTQFLRAQAAPLTVASIPAAWRQALIIHLAPLVREVDPSLLGTLGARFVGLTPQGWLREWDETGRVSHNVAAWPNPAAVLPLAHATVLSIADIGGDWSVAEQWAKAAPVLAVTEGPAGCTVFVAGQGARQFRAPKVDEVDPTGAGDVFAAAFFVHLYETEDPWAAARFANQIAARSVTRVGLEGVPRDEEVGYARVLAHAGPEPPG